MLLTKFFIFMVILNIVSKGKNSFIVFLSVFALAVTTYIIQYDTNISSRAKNNNNRQIAFQLSPGHNSISIPFQTNLTSADLCERLPENSIVWDWDEPSQDYIRVCGLNIGTIFSLDPFEGYFIYVQEDYDLTLEGYNTNQNIDLRLGYNHLGFKQRGNFTASDICNKYRSYKGDLSVREVKDYVQGEFRYDTYFCESDDGVDFNISEGTGYYLLMLDKVTPNPPGQPLPPRVGR